MNYIPLTAAQKQILRDRTLVLARIMERYLMARLGIEDVTRAFNLLIDVEPDLDVALTYAHDRDNFGNLLNDARRTLIEDYRNLAYSPPDRPDKGAPNVEPRQRYAVKRMPLNSDPNDKRDVDLFEPITPEDKIVSVAVDKKRDLYATPKQQGGTADWFDSAKQPEEWTPKPSMPTGEDDIFREGYVVKPIEGWTPPLTREQTQHIERIHGTIPDREMIQRIVLPSHCEPAPEPPITGPIGPPHLESDWSGARVSIVGGDFDKARGKVT